MQCSHVHADLILGWPCSRPSIIQTHDDVDDRISIVKELAAEKLNLRLFDEKNNLLCAVRSVALPLTLVVREVQEKRLPDDY